MKELIEFIENATVGEFIALIVIGGIVIRVLYEIIFDK